MKVIKRNGSTEEFTLDKIKVAISKAFVETKRNVIPDVLDMLALRTAADFDPKIKNDSIEVEQIQDSVEKVLSDSGYADVAKAYILYRKKHADLRNANEHMLNYKKLVDDYLNVADWRVKENSTVAYSLGGLILSNSGAVTANYWLDEVFDEEIRNAHKEAKIHIHDLSILAPYCAGWNLKQLIKEGLGGVPGKITSTPASHLSTLCNQMVNFLGICQNEWCGAQAFSSFDTYLAPFVKVDNLDYKQVKQCIQSFVYGVNTPSRWGCVDTDTEVLSVDGWKKYDELREDDRIYTWNNGRLEINRVNRVVIKEYTGKMHSYQGRHYNQFVSPDHRVLVKNFNQETYAIKHSEEIFDVRTPYPLPTKFKSSELPGVDLTDDEIRLAAAIYTDGNLDFRGDSIHKISIYKSPNRIGNEYIVAANRKLGLNCFTDSVEGEFGRMNKYKYYSDDARRLVALVGSKTKIADIFMHMNKKQAKLFLKTWSEFDGSAEKFMLQYDNNTIRDQLQQIAILAGYTSYIRTHKKTNYVKIRKNDTVTPTAREEYDYDGIIWCPNVDNGTAVFRKDGNTYISGQCQAPFSNITLDWIVPSDLKNLNAVVGGKELDFTYGDCQKEMDMINKAFIEIMIEGDANGRGFQYPIPSYSITKDFDWSETENNKLLFEMTAKYGTPYFSNYVNSDMEPSDVRSMCPLTPETKVLVKSKENGIRIATIHDIINGITKKGTKYKVWTPNGWKSAKPVKVPATEVYEITMSNGTVVRMGKDHLQPTRDKGTLHADELKVGMWIPYNKDVVKSEDIGSYELGFAVGAYIGDGSHDKDAITYTICNFDKSDKVEEELVKFWKHLGYPVNVDYRDNVRFIRVIGGAYDIIKKYVNGSNALEKSMKNRVFNSSPEFKEGLIKGICMTDGARAKKRIYTSSEEMRDNLNQLFNMLGRKTMINYEDNREGRLGTNTNYRIDYPERARYGKLYDSDDQFNYYMITDIDVVDYSGKYLYCFEVDTDDHLFMLANGMYTHNCRLRLDLRELRRKSGGFFGSGESTGSIGVVTINLPHLAYEAETEEDFYDELTHLMDIAARSLKMKRDTITNLMEAGLYPYTKRYLGTFDNHFSTIGLVGMNEAGLNAKWLKKDLTHVETQVFAKNVLNFMREKLSDYQELYGDLYNLEATPAESTSYRFAMHDKAKYPDIITANENGTPYYTNSSHLPVGYSEDIFSALDIQDDLQTLYTSGTVFHAFLGEKLPDWKAAANLVRKIAENYKLPYYTMSPTYSVCADHGYLTGEQYTCPHCGKKTEVYSRITGYYRPIQNWNDGKSQEFKDRKTYDIGNSHLTHSGPVTVIPDEVGETADCEGALEVTGVAHGKKAYLFMSETCPNCKLARALLDKNGFAYEPIIATEHPEMAKQFEVKQAPTLVIVSDDETYTKYKGVSDIKGILITKAN